MGSVGGHHTGQRRWALRLLAVAALIVSLLAPLPSTAPPAIAVDYGASVLGDGLSVTSASGTTSYSYDGVGRRIGVDDGISYTYLHSGSNPRLRTGGASDLEYLSGVLVDDLYAVSTSSDSYTYLTDALGSTVAVVDQSGTVTATFGYSPYGQTIVAGSADGSGMGFTARELDSNGLHYLRSRYYDSELKRFLSEDPAGYAVGPNLYEYAASSPTMLVDPYGDNPWLGACLWGGLVDMFIYGVIAGEKATIGGTLAAGGAGCIMGLAGKWGTQVYKGIRASRATNALDDVASSSRWSRTEFGGNRVYQRSDLIDPNLVDDLGRTNVQRMESGLAPIGPDGRSLQLHHMTQRQTGSIAEVTATMHQQNSRILHINPSSIPSGIDRGAFNVWRADYWRWRARDF